jgi:phenylalanine-4-hydroxylase
LTDEPKLKPFEPEVTADTEYPITKFQPLYFVADSFKSAKDKMSAFALTIPRPFTLRYNPYTQSIETISNKSQIVLMVRDLKSMILS